jgi:hypothetical protein
MPDQTSCVAGSVVKCSSDGLQLTTLVFCGSDHHCAESASGATCETNACTPAAPTCDGNLVTVCKPDGTGPVAGGSDCGASSVCVSGVCQPKVCTPSAFFCKDGNVWSCDSLGLSSTTTHNCAGDEYCDAAAGTCSPRVCTAGTQTCIGESSGTCSVDGSGYTSNVVDCAAAGKVCSAQGCAASAIDEVGETSGGGEAHFVPTFFGNVVSVTTSRKLTKIEMALSQVVMPFQGSLQWAVFERTGGAFNRIATDTTTYSSSSFSGSNALSVPLVAGRSYLIGVYIVPGTDSLVVNEASTAPEKMTFGTAVGEIIDESATLPASLASTLTSTSTVARQRLTTAPP